MTQFWTDERQLRFARGVLFALLFSVLASAFLVGPNSSLYRGDFPAFYSAGYLVLIGRGDEIYNLTSLQSIQQQLWPEFGGVLAMLYPAFYAVLCAPLALFPPLVAKLLFCALLVCALLIAVRGSSSIITTFRQKPLISFVFLLAYPPLFQGLIAAQNTALSLMLLAGTLYFAQRVSRRSDILSGMCLGLWLFKPHLSVVLLAVFLIGKRFWILPGLLTVAAFYYALGTIALGLDWPVDWFRSLSAVMPLELLQNQHQMISILGVTHALANYLSLAPEQTQLLVGTGWLVSASLLVWFLITMTKSFKESARAAEHLTRQSLLAVALTVLISPHTLYYDLGLLLLPCAYFLFTLKRPVIIGAIVYAFSALGLILKDSLPVQPLFILACLSFAFLIWAERSTRLLSAVETI